MKQENTIHAAWIVASLENIMDLILVLFSESEVSVPKSKRQSCKAWYKILEALPPGEVLGKWIQATLLC